MNRLQKHSLKGRTITLKIKYHDFKQITRSKSFEEPQDDADLILETAKELLVATNPEESKIRLLGISLSNFGEAKRGLLAEERNDQLTLF